MAINSVDIYRANSLPSNYLSKNTNQLTYSSGAGLPAGGTSYSWGTISTFTSGTSPLILKKLAQTNDGANAGAVVLPKEYQQFLKNSLSSTLAARQKFSRGY